MTKTTILQAPLGHYRVLAYNSFENSHWIIGDFDTLSQALDVATKRGQAMLKNKIYDDAGKQIPIPTKHFR